MKRRTRRHAFALSVAIAVLATGCANADDDGDAAPQTTDANGTGTTSGGDDFSENVPVDAPGVSDTEIRVGSVTTKTSPLGGQEGRLNDGIKAYFDLVNSQGGIYGRQLRLAVERDDQLANNATEVEALLAQDDVYAAFIATNLFTGAARLAEAGIPTFGWNINAEWAGPENFFPNIAPICFEGCPLLPHALPTLVREAGAKRVAVLGYDVPQSEGCVNGNLDTMRMFGPEVGAEVVFSDDALTYGQTDFSAQVAQMKQKDVDFLVTCVDFNADFAIATEMARQGIRDQVTFYHPNMYNHEFVRENGELLEGDIMLAQITAMEHEPRPDAIQEFVDYAEEHDLTVTELTMQGWIAARQFVDALKAAGPEFTWDNLISAWNRQTWYTAGGWVPPIDWTRQHTDPGEGAEFRSDFECANFVQVRDGEFTSYLAEPGKPWLCWDGRRLDEWQEPVNVAFDGEPFELADVGGGTEN